jgi:hypothetical protein
VHPSKGQKIPYIIILGSPNILILIISLTLLFFYKVSRSNRSNNSLVVIIPKGLIKLDGLAVAS